MRGKRLVAISVAVFLMIAVPTSLWVMSLVGVSPDQRIADATPPSAPTVDLELEDRVLRDTVVFRGVAVSIGELAVDAPDVGDSTPVVVLIAVSPGDPVDSGQLLAVVSDRPVIALSMPVPLYRPLTRGLIGPDVVRYQEALVSLGFELEVDGLFGRDTQAATVALYRSLGVEAATEGDGADAQVLVPLGEIVAVPSLPAEVASVDASVGTEITGPLLTIATPGLVVEARVDAPVAAILTAGTHALVEDTWRVVVESIGSRDETGRIAIRLTPVDPLPTEVRGRDMRVEAELNATDGPVLAVPIAAVRSDADGESLRLVQADGSTRRVSIRVGLSIGGWAEIVGADEPLVAGMLVRAG